MNHKHKISRNSYKTQNEVEHLSETYFKMSQQYNEVKEQSHNEALELDRLKHKKRTLKMNMRNLNSRKMMATKVKIVALL